jgi:hypothetical protein
MTTQAPPIAPPKSAGRPLLWLGIAAALLGLIVYAALLMAFGFLHMPWYAPALATLGVGLIVLSLLRRATVTRIVALVLFGLLTAGEWWFLLVGSRLPAYAGPVSAESPFPDFAPAQHADGTRFTRKDLIGDKDTVLIFFRGHW